jgi:hypothetical protein
VRNSGGFISAFGLYEHIYEAVSEAVQGYDPTQEPELTVLHGVGPFAVSLYRGASALGDFSGDEPPPSGMAVREVRPETAARRFEQHVDTGGGAYVGSNVNTGGGDFVGRDRIVTAGPVATGGSAISTGSGAAVAGNRKVVVTGKVGRDVKANSQPGPPSDGPPSDESPGSDK